MKDNKKQNAFAVTTLSLCLLMLLVTLVGIVIFRIQFDENNAVAEIAPYAEYETYIAMITEDDRGDFWQSVYTGARMEGELQNTYVELFAGDIGTGYSVEERIEIAIAANVDGIIVEGEDSLSLRREIEKARERGIPVVVVNQDMSESERISFVGISRYELGQSFGNQTRRLAEEILKQKDEREQEEQLQVMVLIRQEEDSTGQNLLMSGIREEIQKNPELSDKIQLEIYAIDDSGDFSAEESIRDLFMGQTDVPDILICLSEIYTTCAYQAVIDYNKVGVTNIIGYYDSDTILNAVEKEIVYSTISMDTEQMGRYCVTALSEYLDAGYVSEYYTVDTYVVDASNVAQVREEQRDED